MVSRLSQLALFLTLACAIALAGDTSVLRPPKGARVAIIVFEDLQCPMCRRTAPLVEQASKTYKIPVVRHDFPLPMHNWSYQAAVIARYFDTHSKALGNEFRDYIFENQLEINPQNLRGYAEKFATAHKVDLPFVIDPGGKLAAQVNADRDLGTAIKLSHTPTVYIVGSRNPGPRLTELFEFPLTATRYVCRARRLRAQRVSFVRSRCVVPNQRKAALN